MKINYIPLEQASLVIMGQSPESSTYNEDKLGLPFFQGKADFGPRHPIPRKWCSEPIKIAEPNDILLSVRAPVGPTNICNTKSCIGRGLAAIRVKSSCDYQFLWYYLRNIEHKIARLGVGSTFTAIGSQNIARIKIPVLPIEIQHKIASILQKSESAREKRKETILLADEFIKSMFLGIFGDPIKNPRKWSIFKVTEISKKEKNAIKAGPFGSSLKKEFYVSKGYKIYGQEQVIRDDLAYGNYYISDEKYKELESCKIKAGDILISLVGSYGKISIVPEVFEPGIINPRLVKISLDQNKALPIYFKQLLLTAQMKSKIISCSHGGTMGIINLDIIKKLDFIIPPVSLQQKFANIVQKAEKLKGKQHESEKELDNLFNSLMQRAFRGDLFEE